MHRRKLLQDGGKVFSAALLPVGSLVAMAQRLGGRPSLNLAAIGAAEQVATDLAARYVTAPNGEAVTAAVAHARTLTDRLARASLMPEVRARLLRSPVTPLRSPAIPRSTSGGESRPTDVR